MATRVLAHGGDTPLPALDGLRWLTSWSVEPGVLIPLALAGALYLYGMHVLRRRGDAWSGRRALWWLVGLVVVAVATSSVLGVYDDTLFGVHSLQHMFLQMVAPAALALAAPMTLALRTLPRRPRRVLLAVTHSRPARFVAHPLVAFAIFALTQFVLYYTPLYELTLRHDWLHNVSHLHFVAVGFLFYWAILAIDPVPHRPMFILKFGLVVGMAPMHVLLGLPIMMSDRLIAPSYYVALATARPWGPDPIVDQNLGGAILWAFGDVSAALLIIAFLAQWYKADQRESRSIDRRLDREHGDGPTMRPWWLPAPSAPAQPDGSRGAALGPGVLGSGQRGAGADVTSGEPAERLE